MSPFSAASPYHFDTNGQIILSFDAETGGEYTTHLVRNAGYGEFAITMTKEARPIDPGNITVGDVDRVCSAIANGIADLEVDVDRNGTVDHSDVDTLLSMAGSTIGDVNFDLRFDSADLVQLFRQNEYEDEFDNNSVWSDGDWNCDGEFDTSDLVLAFQSKSYESPVVAAGVNKGFAIALPTRKSGDRLVHQP
ncbi:hypothetical protein ACFL2H_09905 [Planctomycetota bacterium]